MKVSFSRKFLFFPVVAVGLVGFFLLAETAKKPERGNVSERATVARVIRVPELAVVPRVLGYGYIRAGQEWQAVTEVAGQIVEIHPSLKRGAVLAKGDLLVRIDPAKRYTARKQAQAEVNTLLAQLQELEQTERDTRLSLETETRSLALYRTDYERMRKLMESGTISRSELDETERSLLTQENTVQSYRATLNGIPTQRQALQASLASSRSKLQETEIDLDRTYIRAPFDCRLTEVSVEKGQAVVSGETIAKADSLGRVEAMAQMPLAMFRYVLPREGTALTQDGRLSQEAFRTLMGLKAKVRIELGNDTLLWEGKPSRVNDSVDSSTRTLGVYVAVEEAPLAVDTGGLPPLLPNMFCEVELQGQPLAAAVVIPRSALHGNVVYVMTPERRLEVRTVEVDVAQGGLVVLRSGLAAGERVVLTDLVPATQGMLLAPVEDTAAFAALSREAAGEGNAR